MPGRGGERCVERRGTSRASGRWNVPGVFVSKAVFARRREGTSAPRGGRRSRAAPAPGRAPRGAPGRTPGPRPAATALRRNRTGRQPRQASMPTRKRVVVSRAVKKSKGSTGSMRKASGGWAGCHGRASARRRRGTPSTCSRHDPALGLRFDEAEAERVEACRAASAAGRLERGDGARGALQVVERDARLDVVDVVQPDAPREPLQHARELVEQELLQRRQRFRVRTLVPRTLFSNRALHVEEPDPAVAARRKRWAPARAGRC